MSNLKTQISKNIQNNFSVFSHSTNVTSNNSANLKNQLYSLKPQRFTIPKDVNPLFIFQNLINEINQIFPSMSKKISLSTNSNQIRSNLIKNIKNFIEKYKLSQKNFFFSVYLFDKLLTKKINLDMEKIALGSLILSIKFNDIDGNIPKIKNFCEILIKNKNLSINEIKKIEIFCLNKLDYNLSFPQPINFLDIFLLNGIIFNNDEKNNNKISSTIYLFPFTIYEKIILINADYFQFHPFYFVCAIVAYSRFFYGLEKWNEIFVSVFKINLKDFEEVFFFINDLIKNDENKENINSNNNVYFNHQNKIEPEIIYKKNIETKNYLPNSLNEESIHKRRFTINTNNYYHNKIYNNKTLKIDEMNKNFKSLIMNGNNLIQKNVENFKKNILNQNNIKFNKNNSLDSNLLRNSQKNFLEINKNNNNNNNNLFNNKYSFKTLNSQKNYLQNISINLNNNNLSENKNLLNSNNENNNSNKKYYEKNKTLNLFNNNNNNNKNFSLKKENNFEPKMKNFCINLNNYGLLTAKKPSNNYIIRDLSQSYKKNNLHLSMEKNPNFNFKYLQTTQKIY